MQSSLTPLTPLFIICCFFLFGNTLSAQTDTAEVYDLKAVTVQASRFSTRAVETPMAISTLSQSFIQKGQAQLSVNESLDAIPGLFAMNPNNFAQDLRVSIRGFGARAAFGIRGVKILVDGIPESTPDGQAQVDNLDLGVVQKVEVIRGPVSGLYGNASGGVISFQTEEPTSEPFVEMRGLTGSYGLQQYQLKTGQQKGKFGYLMHGVHTQTNGYRDNSGMKNTLLNGKFNYQLTDRSKLTLLANYADSPKADDPGGITLEQALEQRQSARDRNVLYGGGETIQQTRIGLIYDVQLQHNQQLNVKTWYSNRDFANKLPFEAGGIVNFNRDFTGLGATYQKESPIGNLPYRLKFGIDLQNQSDDRTRYNNIEGVQGDLALDQQEEFLAFGTYLVQELQFAPKLKTMLSLRFDWVRTKATDRFLSDGDQSGSSNLNSFNPTFGLIYSPNNQVNIYTNIATNFETPTLNEFSNNPNGSGGFNEELRPQEASNFEVGVKGIASQKVRYELAFFYIQVKDEIVPFEIEQFPGRTFYENAGSTDRAGVEMNLTAVLFKGLTAMANYTYSNFEYVDFADFDGKTLPGIPNHSTFISLNYNPPAGFFGALQLRNIGEMYADNANRTAVSGFTVLNLRAGYLQKFEKWDMEPFLGVNNLLGEEYFDNIRINAFGNRYYEPAPTANFYAGLKLRFGK